MLAVEFENDVNPVTQDYLEDAIARGEHEHAAAVVIVMDTPGGLGSSMRKIVKRILAATVPVVVYVAPSGVERRLRRRGDRDGRRRARDGAADEHRLVDADQHRTARTSRKDLRRKIVNDAAAYIGELAREHGRNVAEARADGPPGLEPGRARGASRWGSPT